MSHVDGSMKQMHDLLDITFIEIMSVMSGKSVASTAALGRAIAAIYDMHGLSNESLEILFNAIRSDLEYFRNMSKKMSQPND